MLGTGLKKFAEENKMHTASGVAYGKLKGYAATLFEGQGSKSMVIATVIADAQKQNWLKSELDEKHVDRVFKVREVSFNVSNIAIVFIDAVGTMKRMREFIDWFFPLLDEADARKVDVCPECGQPMEKGAWTLIDGVAYRLHKDCMIKLEGELSQEHEKEKAERSGSYLTGAVGALLGAAIGAVAWAALYYAGYLTSIIGLGIGVLAERGYKLFKGKIGALKVLIIAVFVILGVVAGTLLAEGYTLYEWLVELGVRELSVGSIFKMMVEVLKKDEEVRGAILKNICMGIFFAALGVFALLKKTSREAKGVRVKELKD